MIYQKGYESEFSEAFGTKHYTYRLDPWMFAENSARDKLLAQFGTTSLKGFGIEQMPAAITAAGAILYYLEFTEHRQTGHISSISRIDEDRYVWIDKFSIRNLELFTANGGQEGCSLFDVLDRTGSPMGARMLRRWISLPLKDPGQINRRGSTSYRCSATTPRCARCSPRRSPRRAIWNGSSRALRSDG